MIRKFQSALISEEIYVLVCQGLFGKKHYINQFEDKNNTLKEVMADYNI